MLQHCCGLGTKIFGLHGFVSTNMAANCPDVLSKNIQICCHELSWKMLGLVKHIRFLVPNCPDISSKIFVFVATNITVRCLCFSLNISTFQQQIVLNSRHKYLFAGAKNSARKCPDILLRISGFRCKLSGILIRNFWFYCHKCYSV